MVDRNKVYAFYFQIVFLTAAGFFWASFLVVFANTSLKNLGFLAKNFWVLSGGLIISFITMTIIETPRIPNNMRDNIFCGAHVISIACSNWFWFAAMKNINAVNCALICSFEVPLTLLAQVTFLTRIGVEGTELMQVVGCLIVFIAIFTRPLLQLVHR